jgi:hypothetical protein
MQGPDDHDQDPNIETSATEALPGSPLQMQSPGSVASSIDNAEATFQFLGGDCFYLKHLSLRRLELNVTLDFFFFEHFTSGHLTGCSYVSDSNADEYVLTAPIGEEVPFDLVQFPHLQLVNLRDELLSPRHIRLLKLYSPIPLSVPYDTHNVRESSLLRCEAYQACLDDLTTKGLPLFAAASYVCGDQTPTQRIICGQSSIGIPQNAYDVLVHLRLENRPRLVWIDCICIKHNDAWEKSHQVGMLHTIYAQAHVVSWLGMGLDIGLPGVSFYLSLLARCWFEEVRRQEASSWTELCDRAKGNLERYLKSPVNALPHRHSLRAIASIFTTDYFTRVWIVQEIVLGKTNAFQVGNESFSLAVLTAAACVMRGLGSEQATTTNRIDHIYHSYLRPASRRCWHKIGDTRPRDIQVVTSLNQGKCSDPRDYIYGVASLFNDSGRYEFDYTLSEAEVFADFTVHCLNKRSQGIDVLDSDRSTMESITAHPDLRSDLPSWCPDWSVARGEGYYSRDRLGRQASGTTEFVYSRPSRVTLALKGLVVSKLKLCCDSILRGSTAGNTDESGFWWFDHSENLRTFFKLQGLKIDKDTMNVVVRIFQRNSSTESIKDWFQWRYVSCAFYRFYSQLPTYDLIALLAPVYLEALDPELFQAARLEIDSRIPREDYNSIRWRLSDMLSVNNREGARLFVTESGMQGAGYPGVREGDLVCIIHGRNAPQILRQVNADDDDHYILVGACNVDGLMYDEGLEMGLTEREFILV